MKEAADEVFKWVAIGLGIIMLLRAVCGYSTTLDPVGNLLLGLSIIAIGLRFPE